MKHPSLILFLVFLISCTHHPVADKEFKNAYYDQAFEYKIAAKLDSAFLFFNKAKDQFLKNRDSLGVGKCLLNMAIISTQNGDYFGAQELSLNAIRYFNPSIDKQHVYLQSNFNNLGLASHNLGNYALAIQFYQKSLSYTVDVATADIVKNNLANAYRKSNAYGKALTIYENILKHTISKKEYARVLSNFAFTKWLQNGDAVVAPELLIALKIRRDENDLWGQNASYAHLADYYFKKRPDSALYFANLMYQVSKKINSADDQSQALQKLIRLSIPAEIKLHFETYSKIEDSIQKARSIAKNQFAFIRYESEKNKADNLALQKENAEKKYQISKQKIALLISILVLVSSGIIAVLWYKKRKQRIDLETQNAIRENQLRTSKKVHDVVANGLYRVMAEIENRDVDKNSILDKLEDMYEKSRDISYEELEFTDQNFHLKIAELLKSFATESTKVLFVGNEERLWEKVNVQIKYELEHILQELMVNMKKHSMATNVALRFEQVENRIHIHYTDNGIGIKNKLQFKNGLTNTGNRINSIQGTITFDTQVEKGLKVHISFPLV